MKFKDIPQFTRSARYQVNVPWDSLEDALESYTRVSRGGGLDLNPDFQRGHVWTQDKQIAYVEFILRGGQSSRDIYLNCAGWMNNFEGPFVLVDGKQRLEAVRAFLRGDVPAFGAYIEDYDQVPTMQMDFIFHINDLKTRKEVLKWYLDLNTGGVVHTSEEIQRVKDLLELAELEAKYPQYVGLDDAELLTVKQRICMIQDSITDYYDSREAMRASLPAASLLKERNDPKNHTNP